LKRLRAGQGESALEKMDGKGDADWCKVNACLKL